MKICVFGDSIAWGAFDVKKGGWVERLKVYAWERNCDGSVYNLGISGDTTVDLLEKFEKGLQSRKGDVALFAIGVNDSQYNLETGENKVPRDKFEDNIRTLLQKSKELVRERVVIVALLQ